MQILYNIANEKGIVFWALVKILEHIFAKIFIGGDMHDNKGGIPSDI